MLGTRMLRTIAAATRRVEGPRARLSPVFEVGRHISRRGVQ